MGETEASYVLLDALSHGGTIPTLRHKRTNSSTERRAGSKIRLPSSVIILMAGLVACSTTYTTKPGYDVTGRGGRSVAQLSSAEQHQLIEDTQRFQQENVWTYTDDTAALATMAGAAEAVLAAHGGNAATRTQAALQGASDSANRAQASVNAKLLRLDIAKAAEWKTSDCLKAAGWELNSAFYDQWWGAITPDMRHWMRTIQQLARSIR